MAEAMRGEMGLLGRDAGSAMAMALAGTAVQSPRASERGDLACGAQRLARARLKRPIDVTGAVLGLIVLAPILLLLALAIAIDSPGSPIFRQRRTGYGGRTFVLYKFRTMTVCEDGPTIAQVESNDARVTRFGRFLRRTSLDELPQLYNILIGEMSLVGPRPHALAHDDYYGRAVPAYGERFLAKPGLTGLAQVSGLRGRTPELRDMAARVNKDLEYIGAWSPWLDVSILLRTAAMIVSDRTAY